MLSSPPRRQESPIQRPSLAYHEHEQMVTLTPKCTRTSNPGARSQTSAMLMGGKLPTRLPFQTSLWARARGERGVLYKYLPSSPGDVAQTSRSCVQTRCAIARIQEPSHRAPCQDEDSHKLTKASVGHRLRLPRCNNLAILSRTLPPAFAPHDVRRQEGGPEKRSSIDPRRWLALFLFLGVHSDQRAKLG